MLCFVAASVILIPFVLVCFLGRSILSCGVCVWLACAFKVDFCGCWYSVLWCISVWIWGYIVGVCRLLCLWFVMFCGFVLDGFILVFGVACSLVGVVAYLAGV